MSTSIRIPVVWQLSISHLADNKTLFRGVILNNSPLKHDKNTGIFKNLVRVVKSYFISTYANKEIRITSKGKSINTTTDEYGGFQIFTDFQHFEEIEIFAKTQEKPLKCLQSYPTTFPETTSNFDVISDIDDTIIVSYTANFLKRISTIIFKTPQKRKTIAFTQKLFTEFNKLNARVFYISKSESNLYGMLTSFINYNKLPKGALFLTPYLKFSQLISSKKAINFKLDNIQLLIKNTGNKKYVLFGDDTQRDIEIYTKIAIVFPQRILKIYIRQTKPKVLLKQQQFMKKLIATNVPITYFKSEDIVQVSQELAQLKNTIL